MKRNYDNELINSTRWEKDPDRHWKNAATAIFILLIGWIVLRGIATVIWGV